MPRYKVGNNTISLGNDEFIAQGGEGSVYVKDKTAYKIYLEPKRMIPLGKIQELSNIDNKRVIKPEQVVYEGNTPVGYTMRYVKNTVALCQLFTRSFKERHKIGFDDVIGLVQDMRETVEDIHNRQVLIVDLNEMNFLVDSKFREVYFIDADSYQTKSFKATAIMESIRDRHSPNLFSIGTDWFSFAIVTFQLFIGIHPYKGRHPTLKGFDERMLANASVFSPDVAIPRNCYPFDVIPKGLRRWYQEVFDKTNRESPPASFDVSQPLAAKLSISIVHASFQIDELQSYDSDVLYYMRLYGTEVTVTRDRVYSGAAFLETEKESIAGVYGSNPYAILQEGEKLRVVHLLTKKEVSCAIHAQSLMVYQGRVYVKYAQSILELTISNCVLSREVARVMMQATDLYPGVVLQNMLGVWIANTFPDCGISYQYRLTDLQGYQVMDARFDSGILMVIATREGRFDRFVFVMNGFNCHMVRKVSDVNMSNMNFVVLDTGVCVMVNEQGDIEAFHIKHPNKIKVMDGLSGDVRLFKNGGKVVFSQENKLFSLSMK